LIMMILQRFKMAHLPFLAPNNTMPRTRYPDDIEIEEPNPTRHSYLLRFTRPVKVDQEQVDATIEVEITQYGIDLISIENNETGEDIDACWLDGYGAQEREIMQEAALHAEESDIQL